MQRVVGLLAQLEGGRGRGRSHQRVHLLEGADEVLIEQRAHFLRLQVVGLVVTGAEHVGAEHDAPLDFRPEARAARGVVHRLQTVGPGRAKGVAHTVVARQVGAGFGGGDDVVAGDGVIGVRQADLAQLAAQLPQPLDSLLHLRTHLGVQAGTEVLLGHADLHSLHRLLQLRRVVRHRHVG